MEILSPSPTRDSDRRNGHASRFHQSPPSSGTSPAVVSAGSQHSPRAIQSRPASRAEASTTTPAAAGPPVSGRDSASAGRTVIRRQAREEQKRKRHLGSGQAGRKRARVGEKMPRRRELQAEDLASAPRHLDEEWNGPMASQEHQSSQIISDHPNRPTAPAGRSVC
ncbi:hypothetical protein HRG_014644 [Hirsutella rhossiliensis]